MMMMLIMDVLKGCTEANRSIRRDLLGESAFQLHIPGNDYDNCGREEYLRCCGSNQYGGHMKKMYPVTQDCKQNCRGNKCC
jgi:hypothetical protein